VLLSFIAHAFALAMLLVIPLMASGALPVPKSGALVMAVSPPPLPVAPPAPRPIATKPLANPDVAPVHAPVGITQEPEIEPVVENDPRLEPGSWEGSDSPLKRRLSSRHPRRNWSRNRPSASAARFGNRRKSATWLPYIRPSRAPRVSRAS